MFNISSFLSTVPFQSLDKWYVEFYLNQKEYSSSYEMILLKDIITPVRRIIKKREYDGKLPIVSKIVFSTGKVVFRNENKTGMDLLDVHKGDLLISSINFHQGAVALNTISEFVCSTHYQTFLINKSLIVPEYLILLLRCPKFIDMVAGVKANGIKNESGYDFIGGFSIPVPSLPEQRKIMNKYQNLLIQISHLNKKADNLFSAMNLEILNSVSSYEERIDKSDEIDTLLKLTSFISTERWEVEYILKDGAIDHVIDSFKFPAMSIGNLQKEFLFGLSVKASLECKEGMIPVLRMTNIQNGEICYDKLKYLPYDCAITIKDPGKWLLQTGDFLITRTNGSKDLVGKAAVFNSEETYTYASYLIRYRFNTELVLPEYVNILFMTPLVREQIAVMRRQGGGQYNLNSNEINSIKIPVPKIKIQKEIIKIYQNTSTKIENFRKQASNGNDEINRFIESTLFHSS